jgi:signal transduction histidine kinase
MTPLNPHRSIRFEGFWSWLTQPSSRLTHPEHRHKAQFLAAALLLLALWQCFVQPMLTLVAAPVTADTGVTSPSGIGIMLVSGAFLLGAFALARSGYYKIASLLVIAYSTAAILLAAAQQITLDGERGIGSLYYFTLVTLFFGLFASLRVTLVVIGVQFAGLGVLLLMSPQLRLETLLTGPGSFLILMSAMVVAFVHYRNTLERLRRQTILDSQLLHVALGKERELSALKTNLMITISHEFRTPLTVIGGSQELLEHYYERLSDEKRLYRFRLIGGQVQHLTRMLDEINLVMQVLSESVVCRPDALNLGVLCQTILDEAKAMDAAAEYAHHFTLVLNNETRPVRLDAMLTSTILKNLLSNAMKYSPPTSVIRLEAAVVENGVRFRVVDHGQGIPEIDKARILEPFYRGSNVGTIKGIGMGLTIVEKYVALHGGTLSFETSAGQGTMAQVFLPTG